MKEPTTYIVGAGGIGCVIGYRLVKADADLCFVEVDAAKLDWGNRHGIRLDDYPPRAARFVHFDDWQPANGDTIYLCVKCYDNSPIIDRLPDSAELFPVQNGYDPLLERRDHDFEMIASFVAKCEPGRTEVRVTRPGMIHWGWRRQYGPSFEDTSQKLFGIRIKGVSDIRPIKATKLMYNAAISPLAAAAGIDNGDLLANPLARNLFFTLLQENYAILRAVEVPLGKVGPFHPRTVSRILRTPGLARVMAKFFVRSLRGTYCSMAGDIEKGRTELDNYNGHLLRLAAGKVDAPCNQAIMDLIPAMTQPDPAILERLHAKFFAG